MRTWWVVCSIGAVVLGLIVINSPESPGPPRPGDDKIAIDPVDLDGLDRAVKERKGSVVLVNFWATWCRACRQLFPRVVATYDKYADSGLAVISVSREHEPEDDREDALLFLKRQHASFTNFIWIEQTERGEKGLQAKFGFPGHLPYAALFGRNGERIEPKDGTDFDQDELLAAIEAALAKK